MLVRLRSVGFCEKLADRNVRADVRRDLITSRSKSGKITGRRIGGVTKVGIRNQE
jgi:hypothetical protein